MLARLSRQDSAIPTSPRKYLSSWSSAKTILIVKKKEDCGYLALGIGVSGITKLICIEPNSDIYENGVSEFYDVDLISDP